MRYNPLLPDKIHYLANSRPTKIQRIYHQNEVFNGHPPNTSPPLFYPVTHARLNSMVEVVIVSLFVQVLVLVWILFTINAQGNWTQWGRFIAKIALVVALAQQFKAVTILVKRHNQLEACFAAMFLSRKLGNSGD